MKSALSKFIIAFEELNYREVESLMKTLWVNFEVEWEKEQQQKGCNCNKKNENVESINTSECILKKSFTKTMKNLTIDLYKSKAEEIHKTSLGLLMFISQIAMVSSV